MSLRQLSSSSVTPTTSHSSDIHSQLLPGGLEQGRARRATATAACNGTGSLGDVGVRARRQAPQPGRP
jgi:hypothetical protein